nr:hypothetical protein [Tanacetum cinerariifolium]
MRIEESFNVTFDESLPKPKSSSLVEYDRIDEPIVQVFNGSSSLQVNVSDEGYPMSLKENRGHPIEQVIGELNEMTLRMHRELVGAYFKSASKMLNEGDQMKDHEHASDASKKDDEDHDEQNLLKKAETTDENEISRTYQDQDDHNEVADNGKMHDHRIEAQKDGSKDNDGCCCCCIV